MKVGMAEHETFKLLWHCACWDFLWISPTFTQLKLHFSILQPATVLLLPFPFGALQAAHADGTMSEWRKLELLRKKTQELSACGHGVHTTQRRSSIHWCERSYLRNVRCIALMKKTDVKMITDQRKGYETAYQAMEAGGI